MSTKVVKKASFKYDFAWSKYGGVSYGPLILSRVEWCHLLGAKTPVRYAVGLFLGMDRGGKKKYQRFTKELGVTPSTFVKGLARFTIKEHVTDGLWRKYRRYVEYNSYKNTALAGLVLKDRGKLDAIESTIDGALADNQEFLIPALLCFQGPSDTPIDKDEVISRIRAISGKGWWKRFCQKPLYWHVLMNQTAGAIIDQYSIHTDYRYTLGAIDMPHTWVKHRVLLTTMLHSGHPQLMIKVARRLKMVTLVAKSELFRHILRDTLSMAAQLGRSPATITNGCRNPEDLRELHDKLSDEIMLRKDKMFRIPYYEDVVEVKDKVFKQIRHTKEVDVELIDSPSRLLKEGTQQKHCVYSYNGQVRSGAYYVLSVSNKDGRSTIGIESRNGELVLDQWYGSCDNPPPPSHRDNLEVLSHEYTH